MSITIIHGIQIPAFDVEMLTIGKLIVVPFNQFQKQGKVFWLYPSQKLPYNLSLEQYYQPEYLAKAKICSVQHTIYPIHIKAWARCELHWHINPEQKQLLPKIAESTIWQLSALEHIFEQYQVLKLLILRVYHLSTLSVVNTPVSPSAFYWNKPEDLINNANENDTPIVSEASFFRRKTLLLTGNLSSYTDIEFLQFQYEQMASKNPDAQQFNYEIKKFLGWTSEPHNEKLAQNLNWINDIAVLGNRSKEEDEEKTNYQAGTDFENIVRDSLEFLGFTIDYAHKGGAGGLDLFCSKPYPLFGECKAGKKIPNSTAVQLLNLGMLRRPDLFNQAAKLIIGPGEPTTQLQDAAKRQGMAIIKPETLEKLVKLQSKHRNSVDLFKLKEYLKAGQSDEEVENYIDQVYANIRLRSQIITVVKELSEQDNQNLKATHQSFTITETRVHYNATHNPKLTDEAVHDLLIELSSPLTGYLGRIKGSDWNSDRFYFLRDLPIN
ncbi:DUF1802 family protein [Nostoc punctiforme UO1]|uniref:DUF1802 family protein n=1 Tax=Nostoc punctiforme TaxID=272131 RepID=UPI0030A9F72F